MGQPAGGDSVSLEPATRVEASSRGDRPQTASATSEQGSVTAGASAQALSNPGEESIPQFRLGFAVLANLLTGRTGAALEDEHHNPQKGDTLQRTSNGLMVWRKADNWTAFTDGFWTWVNGPFGLQSRPNTDRFNWEPR